MFIPISGPAASMMFSAQLLFWVIVNVPSSALLQPLNLVVPAVDAPTPEPFTVPLSVAPVQVSLWPLLLAVKTDDVLAVKVYAPDGETVMPRAIEGDEREDRKCDRQP